MRTGGVIQRFEGLKRHEFAGALFNPPFSRQLEALGFRSLDTAASLMRNYQGHIVAVAKAGPRRIEKHLLDSSAPLGAIDWLYEPANRIDAFAIFKSICRLASPTRHALLILSCSIHKQGSRGRARSISKVLRKS